MVYDLVKEALAKAGYEMVPVFILFRNVTGLLRSGEVDAAMTIGADTDLELPLELPLSDPVIDDHNDAMTLEQSDIDGIADLAGHSVMASRNARLCLPDAFHGVTEHNDDDEVAGQQRQNVALLNESFDVVIADINIFKWFMFKWFMADPRVALVADPREKVIDHNIFDATPYYVAFRDTDVRDAFNTALADLRDSGEYEMILERYRHLQ